MSENETNLQLDQQTIQKLLNQASSNFNTQQYPQALSLYNSLISCPSLTQSHALLICLQNRASLYLALNQPINAVSDCQKYIQLSHKKPISPDFYILYIKALLKSNQQKKARAISQLTCQQYPYHKKLQEMHKLTREKQICNNQDLYVEKMFEKLCQHPKVRNYMKQEQFLTKIQRLIRNPSLAAALQKIDPRVGEAAQVLLMAQEDWQ